MGMGILRGIPENRTHVCPDVMLRSVHRHAETTLFPADPR